MMKDNGMRTDIYYYEHISLRV